MFDNRDQAAVTLEVRQNEVIVVRADAMREVQYMYTGGMSPCVGLALWCPVMCAVGHFHHWLTLDQCQEVIGAFSEISREQPQRKAIIIRAIGNTQKGGAWHSEHMVSDLGELLKAQGLQSQEVRPAALGDAAKVCVCLQTGKVEYDFGYPGRDSGLPKTPPGHDEELPDWVKRPESAEFLVIAVCKSKGDGRRYERGHSRQFVKNLLVG